MNVYFGEPDSPAQMRRWVGTARRWLESEDVIGAALPDPCSPRDIVAAIEVSWKNGWHAFAREQRIREGEDVA